jgi:NAD(P)-dependent dehydrogenase (short-subunit alcohol dehydrogenase family)
MPTSDARVWFITGSSKGLGWEFVDAALKAGDRVVATARDPKSLTPFVEEYGDQVLAFPLDVTDESAITAAVENAIATFGRLDIVVNNAGYGLRGAIEEVTDAQIRRQMETNFFGALAVTRAVLPLLREQRSGHIVQISTMGGVLAFPRLGMYHASKWALEGMTESLAQEVAPFNIKVTIVEPSGFDTYWNNASMEFAETMPEYDEALGQVQRGNRPAGDPKKTGPALLEIVNNPNPPPRVLWGNAAFDRVMDVYGRRIAGWKEWEAMSRSLDYES